MIFCNITIISNQLNLLGLFNDCCVLLMEIIGFLWISFYAYKSRKLFHYSNLNDGTDYNQTFYRDKNDDGITMNIENTDELIPKSLQWMVQYNYSLLYIFIIFQILIAIFIVIYGFSNNIYGCHQISSVIIIAIRIASWLLVLFYTRIVTQSSHKTRFKKSAVFLCFGWSITEIVSGGLNCIQYLSISDPVFLINVILYFSFSGMITIFWGFVIINLPSSTNESKNGSKFCNIFCYSIPKNNFKDEKPHKALTSLSSSVFNPLSSPRTIDFKSLWSSTNQIRASISSQVDEPMVDVRLSDDSCDSFTISLEYNNSRSNTIGDHINSKKSFDYPAVDRSSQSTSFSHSYSNNLSMNAALSSIVSDSVINARNYNRLSFGTMNRVADQPTMIDVTIQVVECERVYVNNRSVLVYKLGLGEYLSLSDNDTKTAGTLICTRSIRIITKRLDELMYLRDKIVLDFPFCADEIPAIPILTSEEIDFIFGTNEEIPSSYRKVTYDFHIDSMTKYLQFIVNNPITNRLVVHNIRGSSAIAKSKFQFQAHLSNISKLSNDKTLDIKPTIVANQSSALLPLLSTLSGTLDVSVVGWIDLNFIINPDVKPRANLSHKIYYEVEVQNNSCCWILRKRFRQFRALYATLIKHGYEDDSSLKIQKPVKHSVKHKTSSVLSEEDETKVSLLTSLTLFPYSTNS